ncbi:hypothetical protein N656DRAFT_847984 [Canariomyces notabilis]|uniref:DUF7730 domain-containing protein n=1 Tax=Canariomyces notabilis TaxID=2074819 RepID=A0AAN6QLM0_9PEZI|nr:hypothetical protein N656DRAFT_847984 [Canariomyces arenarius]
MAGRGPDIALLSRTSNPQLTSLFFTRLPIEIRNLIYLEFWNLSSSRLHIHAEEVQLPRTVVPSVDPRSRRLRWSHTRCIADPRAPDARIDGCSRARYLECLPSIYSNTTFVFTNEREAVAFLLAYGQDDDRYPLRSLELCVRVSSFVGWIYASEPEDEVQPPPHLCAGPGGPGVSIKSNSWHHVCDLLAKLPILRSLHVWVDADDSRPWHRRTRETRFFKRLFDVRVANGGSLQKIKDAPFVVERGPRPAYWDSLGYSDDEIEDDLDYLPIMVGCTGCYKRFN